MKALCQIIDDHPHVVEHITNLVNEHPQLELLAADTDPLLGLNKILTGVTSPDIIFLDIDMPELDGISFSKQVEQSIVKVFITAHSSYAIDAFDIGAADYLLKPIDEGAFRRAVNRAMDKLKIEKLRVKPPKWLYVRLDTRNLFKVKLKNIIYVEADDKRITLHLMEGEPITVLRTINKVEAVLPDSDFLRIHRSFIVNLRHVGGLVGRTLVMAGGATVIIGPNYTEAVHGRFRIL
jgi:DNA-binding LytR/AlgR family response regulator